MVTADLDSTVSSKISIRLFQNVENVADLKKKAMSGEIECCFINPKLIVDPFQIVVAANKALTSEKRTTKSIFTEILFNLSMSKHISQSLQKFGINEDTNDLLVVTISENDVAALIKGEEKELSALNEIRDLDAIKKSYKISEIEEKSTSLLDSVVSRIATKDII